MDHTTFCLALGEKYRMANLAIETKTATYQSTLWNCLWPALAAGLLGLVILYGTGFAPLEAHNAAHDAHHSAGFPCH